MDLQEMGRGGGVRTDLIWFRLGQVGGFCKCGNEASGYIKCGEILD
jgi:hypothetical protein